MHEDVPLDLENLKKILEITINLSRIFFNIEIILTSILPKIVIFQFVLPIIFYTCYYIGIQKTSYFH